MKKKRVLLLLGVIFLILFPMFTTATAPSVVINEPTATTYASTNITLNTTISDINLDSCWYSLDNWSTNTSYDCNLTTFIASEGSNTVRVAANDTAGNLNDTESVTFTVDTSPPKCTRISQTPANLNYSSNGSIVIKYRCTDASGFNFSAIGLAITTNHTTHSNLNSSIRYPSNTKAGGYKDMFRGEHRNESEWYERLFTNIYEWSFHSGCGHMNITWNGSCAEGYCANITFTKQNLQSTFHNFFPLDKDKMESSGVNYLSAYRSNNVIDEIYLPKLEPNATLTVHIYLNDTGAAQGVNLYLCNDSKESDGFTTVTSPNCNYFGHIDQDDPFFYCKSNVCYHEFSMYVDENLSVGGVKLTEKDFVIATSEAPLVRAWKRFYSDNITLVGNISFNDSGLLYTSSDDGVTFTQHNGSGVIWISAVHDAVDEDTYKMYSQDNSSGNHGGWSATSKDAIGVIPTAPEAPAIIHINGDYDLNGSYAGIFDIGCELGNDPNGEPVTGNLTLRNTDGSLNHSINGSFSDSGLVINVSFNSSLVADGTYRLNLTNCDNTSRCSSTLTGNFTIDNTPINISITYHNPTEPNGTTINTTHTLLNISIEIADTSDSLDTFRFNISGQRNISSVIYDDSLVLALNFNNYSAIGDNETHVMDISQYGNNGTMHNGTQICGNESSCPHYVAGRFGQAMSFDGVNDYVDCGNDPSLDTPDAMTIETWVKYIGDHKYDSDHDQMVVIKAGAYREPFLFGVYDNHLQFTASHNGSAWDWWIQGAAVYGSTGDSNWHYHAVTFNSAVGAELFTDGVSVGTDTTTGTLKSDAGANILIGKRNVEFFEGSLDEVRIYSRALSADEILFHFRTEFQRHNSTEYRFYSNLTNLTDGVYQHFGWGNSSGGDSNTSETRVFTVSISPSIVEVQAVSAITLTAFSTTSVHILFNVSDPQGYADLNDSKAYCSLSKPSEATRSSSSCSAQSQAGNDLVYNCSLPLQFYDGSGQWNITCYAEDNSGNAATNDTEKATVNVLHYVSQDVLNISWTSLLPNQNDQEANTFVSIKNGGNSDYATFNISSQNATYITSTILHSQFSVDNETGQTTGQTYLTSSGVIWPDGSLPRCTSPCATNSTEQIYSYLDVPKGILPGVYSSISSWVISLS